jgi:polar amino acid transport system substrate-binding protein
MLLSFHAQAAIEEAKVRIITEHLAPFQISENHELVGGTVAMEIKQLISKVLPGNKIEVLPWARAFQIASERPNTIIFSLVRTPERENNFIWIGKVAHVPMELIALKTSKLQPISSLSELKDIQIGVKRLDAVTIWLASQGLQFDNELVEIVNTLTTMQMLEKGRIDVIPSTQQVIEFYCKKAGCKTSDFKTIYTLNTLSEDFYLAVSLGTDENLIKQLSAEFTQLNFPVH